MKRKWKLAALAILIAGYAYYLSCERTEQQELTTVTYGNHLASYDYK